MTYEHKVASAYLARDTALGEGDLGTARALEWSVELVEKCVAEPGRAGRLVTALLDQAVTEDQIAYVAAGPLEDVVDRGDRLDLAELETGVHSAKLLSALRSIRISDQSPAAEWLESRLHH